MQRKSQRKKSSKSHQGAIRKKTIKVTEMGRERERERERERRGVTLPVRTVHKWYYEEGLKWGLLNAKDICGVLHKLHGRAHELVAAISGDTRIENRA